MSKKNKRPEFVALHEDTIEELSSFIKTDLALGIDIKFVFVGSTRQKECVKIKKVSKIYEFVYDGQILVIVNEELYEKVALDTEAIKILLVDAFSGLEINHETGDAKINNEQFVTSAGVIRTYGIDKVKNAKDLEKSILEQIKEQEQEMNDSVDISM